MELNAALKRAYAADTRSFPRYLSSAFSFSNGLLLLCAAILLALLPWLPDYQGLTAPWFFAVLMLAYFRFHTVVLHHLLQLTNCPLSYGLWGLAVNLGTFGLTFTILYWKGMGWQARAWSELLVALVTFPIAIFFFRKDFALRLQFDWRVLKSMLRFSFPLLMSSMIGYLLQVMDRLFIAELVGSEQLGLYAVAIQLSSVVGLFFGAILPVWESWIYRMTSVLHARDLHRILRWLATIMIIALIFNFLVPSMVISVLPYLVDRNFVGVESFLQPAIMVALVAALFGLMGPVLIFMRKVAFIAKVNIAMLFLCIPILYYFVRHWGVVGAAYGLTTVYGVGLVCMIIYICRYASKAKSMV